MLLPLFCDLIWRIPHPLQETIKIHPFLHDLHVATDVGASSRPNLGASSKSSEDIKRRDSVTGDIYPLCSCLHPKFFNSSPNECDSGHRRREKGGRDEVGVGGQ